MAHIKTPRSTQPTSQSISPEFAQVIEFARQWAPYGGPSDEDVFIRFGMSRPRFNREVWELLIRNEIDLSPEYVRLYAAAYPSPIAHSYARGPRRLRNRRTIRFPGGK